MPLKNFNLKLVIIQNLYFIQMAPTIHLAPKKLMSMTLSYGKKQWASQDSNILGGLGASVCMEIHGLEIGLLVRLHMYFSP